MKNGETYITYIVLLLILIELIVPVNALKEPWQYKEGECELVAKEYQKIYGGYLIFVQHLKENGAFDLGPYNGWFLNKAYNKERGIYYIDYMNRIYFNNTQEILESYYRTKGNDAIVYNMNDGGVPFPFIWHY